MNLCSLLDVNSLFFFFSHLEVTLHNLQDVEILFLTFLLLSHSDRCYHIHSLILNSVELNPPGSLKMPVLIFTWHCVHVCLILLVCGSGGGGGWGCLHNVVCVCVTMLCMIMSMNVFHLFMYH